MGGVCVWGCVCGGCVCVCVCVWVRTEEGFGEVLPELQLPAHPEVPELGQQLRFKEQENPRGD